MVSTQRRGMVATFLTVHTDLALTMAGAYCLFNGRAIDRCSLATHLMPQSLSLSCKLAALFGGALLTIFAASLAVEDQRRFLSCRASGVSVDACLLQINGR
jgi:hypothetical protein